MQALSCTEDFTHEITEEGAAYFKPYLLDGLTSHFNVVTLPWQGTFVVQLAVPNSRVSKKAAQHFLDRFCEAIAAVNEGGTIVL